ncbi:Cell wall protein PRY3 [Beauveria bassiana D1-5]|uniref:Cell wall protein PRY3 n=1 Tax=Beauveria bassiana D1-5 TaxID=1245745 RepID=A0A0A2VFE0_BEABA|nr:Cell wall protein PRY3 [Beauveria bassiana D1-5]
MLADSFSKTAVLALAAMAHATPFSWGTGGWEAGNFKPSKFEHGKFEHGNYDHGNWDHGNWNHGDWQPGQEEPGQEEPGKVEPGPEEPGKTEPGQPEPSETEPGAGDSSDFKSQMLAAHNWYRGQHSAAALKWDDNLASKSLAWASKCSENPRHDTDRKYGENIAWGTSVTASYEWVNLWGKERAQYKFDQPGFGGKTGHFTQLVWKGTTSVGCAEAKCSYGTNVVCKYDPPGNMMGENGKYFRENVVPQTSGQISDHHAGDEEMKGLSRHTLPDKMSKHPLPPSHRTALDNAAVLQVQTLLQRPELEAIWDAFHLLDCIHFHATSLGPSAIHSIHTVRSPLSLLFFPSSFYSANPPFPKALWKLIQSLYAEKRYTVVLSYCHLALHPSLTPSLNTPVFQRRLLAVLVDLGDYTDAFTLFESLPASTRDDLSTRVLVFRLAARAWNRPLAQECLQFFARTNSGKEAARDALYACVREAQTAGARLCTVQALTAAAASWKGEVVVAAHVASLLRCAIRLLQAMAAAEGEESESNVGFASSEVVALFHTAAEFVASNARDDHGDFVFPAAELRWFSTNAYNLGVVHCTLWESGRLVSLFQSCLVFTQALSSSTSTSDNDDATDAADWVLTVLRCHFVLASLYMSEAQLPNNEHTPSLYADVERHASAYATLFTETCGAAATSKTCPDLRQKLGVLYVFHCEALLSRQCYDHVSRIIKQVGRLCSDDVNVLKTLGGCVIQSEVPVTGTQNLCWGIAPLPGNERG